MSSKIQRPESESMSQWFAALCTWLEKDSSSELFTVKHLHKKMSASGKGEEVYSEKHLRRKLKDHYGDHVLFASIRGSRQDIVCFKEMASYIVSEKWYEEQNDDSQTESQRLMNAKLVLK